MEGWIEQLPRLFTELDGFLVEMIQLSGVWFYALLFAIVFCETGLVVTPFLPGDSLLFAVGALCARDIGITLETTAITIVAAAFIGDTVNYHLGKWLGVRAFSGRIPFLKVAHLERTRKFFEKHGPKAVVLARFVPIVRTFAPFLAGIGTMTYRRFMIYNLAGAILWVTLLTGAGYLFGELPIVRKNFELVIGAIVVVSVLPVVIEWWRARKSSASG